MEAKKYTIQNQTRDTPVSTGVTAINSTLEPLAALRGMVEGLESDNRVVERVDLLPATEIPRFKKPSASVLVLPFRTISSSKIEPGDQLAVQEVPEGDAQGAEEKEIEVAAPAVARVPAQASL